MTYIDLFVLFSLMVFIFTLLCILTTFKTTTEKYTNRKSMIFDQDDTVLDLSNIKVPNLYYR